MARTTDPLMLSLGIHHARNTHQRRTDAAQ